MIIYREKGVELAVNLEIWQLWRLSRQQSTRDRNIQLIRQLKTWSLQLKKDTDKSDQDISHV